MSASDISSKRTMSSVTSRNDESIIPIDGARSSKSAMSAAVVTKTAITDRLTAGVRRKKFARRRAKHPESEIRQQRGVMYLGHIPHGFYEAEMRGFFAQFGKVTRVRLCRSNDSGKSKGYAFIEFSEPEVAKIAAETMDGYMMFDKRLQCHVVPAEHVHRDTFRPRILGMPKKPQTPKGARKVRKPKSDSDVDALRDDGSTAKPVVAKPILDPVALRTKKFRGKVNKLAKLGIVVPLELAAGKPSKTAENMSETPAKTTLESPAAKKPSSQPNSIVASNKADQTLVEKATTRKRRQTALPAVSTSPANKTPPIAKRTRSHKPKLL